MHTTSIIKQQIITKKTTIQRNRNNQVQLDVIVLHRIIIINVQPPDSKKFIVENSVVTPVTKCLHIA